MIGTVTGFDSAMGWGQVAAANGVSYPFHCTAVAGGARAVEVGAQVVFWLAPGHRGVWEAAGITPR